MCQTAWMMRAASTASGRLVKSGVRKSRVTIVAAQATRLATCVRAPAPSFTADPDMPPAASIPPNRPLARFTTACALSSWSGVDLVAVLLGELVGDAERLAERHEEDADRGKHHRQEVLERHRRQRGRREALGQGADNGHAPALQVERGAQGDRPEQDDEPRRQPPAQGAAAGTAPPGRTLPRRRS